MRLGMVMFVVKCDKVRKVMDTRQIKNERGENGKRGRGDLWDGICKIEFHNVNQ
jgi:hypothetical protein